MQAKIETLISDNKVMVFSKDYCPFCTQAKDVLKNAGVEFKAVEMDMIPNGGDMQNKLHSLSGQRTVPNTYIGGVHLGGCDDLKAAKSSGKLKQMLEAAGVSSSL